MSDLTLDQLLASLQSSMTKSAEDEKKDEDKKEDGDKKEEKNVPPWLKDKEGKGEDKKDEKKDEKKEESKDESKKEDEGQEKSASEAGAALAREIMEKVASINLETPEMNKQAQTAGQALASALLTNLQKKASEKTASAGDMTVMDGGAAPGTVPNKVQADVMEANAEGASYIKPMLTSDGLRPTGTINEIFDAMVQDAISQGAASEDQVHDTGVAKEEGSVEEHAVPNQVKVASEQEQEDDLEKAAAISELVAQGIDFGDAVELVKQAAVEIEFEMEKAAAMTALMAEGVNFDEAIELVKQASAGDMTVMDGGAAPGTVPNKVQADVVQANAEGDASIKPMPTGDGVRNSGSINQIFDAIVQDAMSQGAASEEQVHDTGVAKNEGAVEDHAVPSQVKVAAINRMVEAGVDFEDAVNFVKEASIASMATRLGRRATVGVGRAGQTAAELAGKGSAKAKAMAASGRSMAGAAGNRVKEVGGAGLEKARNVMAPVLNSEAAGKVKGAYSTAMNSEAAGKVRAAGSSAADAVKGAYGAVKAEGSEAVRLGKLAVNPASNKFSTNEALTRKTALQGLAKNRVVQGGAAALAVGGAAGGYALAREKKAAFDALVEAGVDFDQAAVLVSQKSQELYGE